MYCLSQFCCTCLCSDASLQILDRDGEGARIFNVIVKMLPKIVLDRVVLICDNCVSHFRYMNDFLSMCMKNNKLLAKYVGKLDPTGENVADARVEMVDFKVSIEKEIKEELSIDDGADFRTAFEGFESCDEREDKVIVHDDFSEVFGKIKSEFSVHSPGLCDDITNNLTTKDPSTRSETPEKPSYSCRTCEKHFDRLTKLRFHEKTHDRIEKISSNICMICQKTFHCPSYLYTHYLIHTGETPFKCEKCDKQYRSKKALQRHQITHTGKDPFPCKTCGKKFSSFSQLNRHRKEHVPSQIRNTVIHTVGKPTECVEREGYLRCEDCDRTFRTRNGLLHHRRMHQRKNPYKCSVCNKYYSSGRNLRMHYERFV